MTDTPPDRLSVDPRSPHYNAAALERGVGIRFNARERDDVEEYSVSEGWVRVPAGKALAGPAPVIAGRAELLGVFPQDAGLELMVAEGVVRECGAGFHRRETREKGAG